MSSVGGQVNPAYLPGKGYMNARSRARAILAVETERNFQDYRWGNHFPERTLHEWLTILTEEVGELAEAILDYDRQNPSAATQLAIRQARDGDGATPHVPPRLIDRGNLREVGKEAALVAAVAVCILEWITAD